MLFDCGILRLPPFSSSLKISLTGSYDNASHNPPEYNGVKIIEADGTEMGDDETVKLEHLIFDVPMSPLPWDHIGA